MPDHQEAHPQAGATAGLSPDEIRNERRALARRRRNNLLLVAPLLLFVGFAFLAPLASMLYRSVYNPTLASLIPATLQELSHWGDQHNPPGPEVYQAMALELKQLAINRQAGVLAAAVNQVYPGASSLINSSARKMRSHEDQELAIRGAELLRATDARWQQTPLWLALADAGRVYTDSHYLTALDLERTAQGIQARKSTRIYLQLYGKTMGMSLLIVLLCAMLGYPLAYYLAHLRPSTANLLLALVLLPFWTSLLVRTSAWLALLQANGAINSVLLALGLIEQPLELLYTEYATVIVLTHVLLPFMILPLYSIMRGIDPSFVRAATSLGGSPWNAFRRVYLPLSLPGLGAGSLLVFIISVGFYVIPALVGGTKGQMISNLIAFHMQRSNNWGLAAALGTLLLVLVLALYVVYDRIIGMRNLRLG